MVTLKNNFLPTQIQTTKPDGTIGAIMPTRIYLEVAHSIFTHLSQQDEVTTVDLLSHVGNSAQGTLGENKSLVYIALHVKLDLESRKYLKTMESKTNPTRIQKCIRITKSGWKYFKSLT